MKSAFLMLMKCPNVLIIEDEVDIRDLCQEFLGGEGFTTDAVSNGHEAIEYLKNHGEPCLILLDMMMPIMDGRQFMLELEKQPSPVSEVPVYLVSASAQNSDGQDMGCSGFLKKPYELNDILTIVKEHCDQTSLAPKQANMPEGIEAPGLFTSKNNRFLQGEPSTTSG